MTTAAIIQARATSTRFPNKVLKPLAGASVLGHVIIRGKATQGIDVVCCAIPIGDIHDDVAKEAERYGAVVFRGSEKNVLSRFAGASRQLGADVIMRVTSDCPLADPQLCAKVIQHRIENRADYACNNMPPSWPHGLDCEVFTSEILYRAEAEAKSAYEREHVTPWMRTTDGISRENIKGPGGLAAQQRWTLDFPEDYQFLTELYSNLPPLPTLPSVSDILAILESYPEIAEINAQQHDVGRAQSVT